VLFDAVCRQSLAHRFVFALYGHPTPYYRGLQAAYPQLRLELVTSAKTAMDAFLVDAHGVVSVATHEGFGRPVALALAAGLPCLLLRSPVFEEFFGSSTALHNSVELLVGEMSRLTPRSGNVATLPDVHARSDPAHSFAELPHIRAAFQAGVTRLNCLAAQAGAAT
jgi:hypothetical protein